MPRCAGSTSPCSRCCRSRWCAASAPSSARVIAAVHRDHGVDLRTGVDVDGDRRRRRRPGRAACGSATAATSTPTSSWSASASCPRRAGSRVAGSRSTTAWCATRRARRARTSSRPATSRAGPTRCSTGSSCALEHWTNATEQGVHAARRLLARRRRGSRSRRCRSCGPTSTTARSRPSASVAADAEVHVAHGTLDERQFVALFGRDGRLVGALGFNRPRDRHAVPPADRRARARGTTRSRSSRAMRVSRRRRAPCGRALTPRFMLVVACGLCYFLALGDAHAGAPALRRRTSSATASVAVGVAVGAFAVGAVVLRPYAGRLGDRIGRRVADHRRRARRRGLDGVLRPRRTRSWWLVADAHRHRLRRGRVLRRRGDDDHRPRARRAARRGVSYWSVAVYGGLAFGPALGELCAATTATTLTCARVGRARARRGGARAVHRRGAERDSATEPHGQLLHRAAVAARHRAVPRADPAGRLHRVRAALRRRPTSASRRARSSCSTAC